MSTLFLLPLLLAPSPGFAQDGLPDRVTFSEHIAPIIYANCTGCHRPGEIAPFPLIKYRDIKKRAKMIRRVTEKRFMPPWHPEPGHGEFWDSRRLSDRQIALIKKWTESGRAEGPKSKMPKLPKFAKGWQLGKPDLVVKMPKAYKVRADGRDIYRSFVVPVNLPEDKWVTAVEVRGSKTLHHTIIMVDPEREARERDGRDGTPGFREGFRRGSRNAFRSLMRGDADRKTRIKALAMAAGATGDLGAWAVGATPRKLPKGLARLLPAGSDIVLQSHIHPSGKIEYEKTSLGLHFAKKPPKRTLVETQGPPAFGALSRIDIPPGEKNYKVSDSFKIPADFELLEIWGHAYYICKSMRAVATLPDGEKVPLLYIKNWDFDWQGVYTYEKPVQLPASTKIDVEIVWDNSADNPSNPNDPPQRIRWGTQSTDEMGSVTFRGVTKNEDDVEQFYTDLIADRLAAGFRNRGGRRGDGQGGGRRGRRGGFGSRLVERLKGYDKNDDGKIQKDELPRMFQRNFDRYDKNKDGALDDEELKAVAKRFGG